MTSQRLSPAETTPTIRSDRGGMAERTKAAVLKTAGRKPRGFESLSLRLSKRAIKDVDCRGQVIVVVRSPSCSTIERRAPIRRAMAVDSPRHGL